MNFPGLSSHIHIGELRVENRIVFPAHRTNLAGKGRVSHALLHYYRERALGGCGMIVVGEFSVHPNDRPYLKMIELYDRGAFDGVRELGHAIKNEGASVFGQITHRGFQSQGAVSRRPLWGPEPIADVVHGEVCQAMEEAHIAELTEAFAQAATLLKEAGFDGVEIDVGETSLLRQFLSPLTNHRPDEYGGDLSNRLRLTVEALAAVKAAVGDGFPVGVRLCLDEIFWGALTIEESVAAARTLEEMSLVDYFGTSIGTYYNLYLTQASMHNPVGLTLERTAQLKEAVSVPVVAGNRIHTPQLAEQVLESGQADMIGWIRPLICDPHLPAKLQSGEMSDIVFCASDNQNCVGRAARLKPVACVQNPWAGREIDRPEVRVRTGPEVKRVMVIGAGPAGLEAALTAAKLGHTVTLYEREKEPGGQLRLARLGAGRQEIWNVVENLTRRLALHGVPMLMETPVDVDAILSEAPDAVIVATGSSPNPRPVPGDYSSPTVLNVWEALQHPDSVGERVILVDENGHHQATATAEFLADRGRKVDIMTSEAFVGLDLSPTGDLYLCRQRLIQKGIRFLADRILLRIDGNVLTVADKFTEEVSYMEGYDTVVLVMGNIPDETLYQRLKGKARKVLRAGDCVAPRRVDMAILEGNQAAQCI